jgi:hypothetical protein
MILISEEIIASIALRDCSGTTEQLFHMPNNHPLFFLNADQRGRGVGIAMSK